MECMFLHLQALRVLNHKARTDFSPSQRKLQAREQGKGARKIRTHRALDSDHDGKISGMIHNFPRSHDRRTGWFGGIVQIQISSIAQTIMHSFHHSHENKLRIQRTANKMNLLFASCRNLQFIKSHKLSQASTL